MTFKKRFMYMSGIQDEGEFNEFCKSITWEGHADKIEVPYLCVTGEFDPLSPLEHTERLFQVLPGPKQLVIYQGAGHTVAAVPSAGLGPFPMSLIADWVAARLQGQPFDNERWFVNAAGQISKTPLI